MNPPSRSKPSASSSSPVTGGNHVTKLSGNVLGMRFMARAQEARALQDMQRQAKRSKVAAEWTLPVDRRSFLPPREEGEAEGGEAETTTGTTPATAVLRYGRRSFQDFNRPIHQIAAEQLAQELAQAKASTQSGQRGRPRGSGAGGKEGEEASISPKEMATMQRAMKEGGGPLRRKAGAPSTPTSPALQETGIKATRFSLLQRQEAEAAAISSPSHPGGASSPLDAAGFMKPPASP